MDFIYVEHASKHISSISKIFPYNNWTSTQPFLAAKSFFTFSLNFQEKVNIVLLSIIICAINSKMNILINNNNIKPWWIYWNYRLTIDANFANWPHLNYAKRQRQIKKKNIKRKRYAFVWLDGQGDVLSVSCPWKSRQIWTPF